MVETSPFSTNFQSDENKMNCPVLEDIDLRHNCLKSIPSWLFTQLPIIRRIDVSYNGIERLHHCVWLCSSLVELNLSHNCLTTIPVAYRDISDFISSIELDGVRPSTPQSDNASETTSITGLSHLSLAKGQDFVDVPVTHAERWRNHVKVKMASFDSEEFDASGRPKRRSLLKELDLSHNFLSDTPPVLACVAPSLERLYLSHNQFRSMGSLDIYPVNLLVLDLSCNQISTNEGSSCEEPLNKSAYICRTCQSPFQPRRFEKNWVF
jgi:Leucine-rich repeat (LRR) protein